MFISKSRRNAPDSFASDSEGLARVAREALAAKGVRSGKLSAFQARTLLGIQPRNEVDGFLKEHGVFLDLTFDRRADGHRRSLPGAMTVAGGHRGGTHESH